MATTITETCGAQPPDGKAGPAHNTPIRPCHRCGDTRDTVTAVAHIEAISGPGFTVWGCPTCTPLLR